LYDFNQKPELNITPLVDVMLVLLAILMITAPTMEYEENLKLPNGSAKTEISNIQNIKISIRNDKIVDFEGKQYSFIVFQNSFKSLMGNTNKETQIQIRADKNLLYNDVMNTLKVIKDAGFYKVSLITDGV